MAAIRRDFTLADLAPLTAAAGDECLADGFTEGGVPGKSRNRVHAQDGDALGSQARGALRD